MSITKPALKFAAVAAGSTWGKNFLGALMGAGATEAMRFLISRGAAAMLGIITARGVAAELANPFAEAAMEATFMAVSLFIMHKINMPAMRTAFAGAALMLASPCAFSPSALHGATPPSFDAPTQVVTMAQTQPLDRKFKLG